MIKFLLDFSEDFTDPRYCAVDPISLGIGGLVGSIASLFGGGSHSPPASAAAQPTTPPPPQAVAPPPSQAPQRSETANTTPSFIGSSAVPSAGMSNQKSLLGS